MRTGPALLSLLLVPALALSSGCSWTMATATTSWTKKQAPDCDDDYIRPGVDAGLGAVALTLGTVFLVVDGDPDSNNDEDVSGPLAAISLVTGAVLALSAAVGFSRAHRCRKQQAEHDSWLPTQSTVGSP